MNTQRMVEDLGLSRLEKEIFNRYLKNIIDCEKLIMIHRNNVLVMKVKKELDVEIKREREELVKRQREQNHNIVLLTNLTNSKYCNDIYDYIKHNIR